MRYLLSLAVLWSTVAYAGEPPPSVYARLDSIKSDPPATKFTQKATTVTSYKTVTTTRAPIGHTHTCANGHTWDHQANPTHTCKICGLSQFTIDSRPRMVTELKSVPVTQNVQSVSTSQPVQPAYQPQYTLGTGVSSSSPCANGNCPTSYGTSRPRFQPFGGLFGR